MGPYLATFLASLVLLGATVVPAIPWKPAATKAARATSTCVSVVIHGKQKCFAHVVVARRTVRRGHGG